MRVSGLSSTPVRAARTFETVWRSLIPAALMLGAGLIAYVIQAAGEFGPNFAYGRADANAAIPNAWIQLPLHAGLAFLLVIGRPRGLLWLAWALGRVGLILLVVWTAFWTLLIGPGAVVYVGLLGLTALLVPLLLYGVALYLALWDDIRPILTGQYTGLS